MKKNEEIYSLKPIGKVRIEGNNPEDANFLIVVEKPYHSALKELNKFSHVMVFWWANEMDKEEFRASEDWTVDIPYAENAPRTGVFATRAEYRPNPIAVTTVEILNVDEKKGIVKINHIDAFDGTPVLDLKAYFPICDRIRNCHIAPWLKDWPDWMEDGYTWWQEQGFFAEE